VQYNADTMQNKRNTYYLEQCT